MPRFLLRDRDVCEWIETTLAPRLIDAQSDREVRVWCVDCPAPEDAYALAMLLRDAAAQRRDARSIRVFASSCSAPERDDNAVAQARDGFFPEDVVRPVAGVWRRRLFVRDHERYRVRRAVRDLVTFSAHDLFADPPPARLDLIVCSELLDALAEDARRDVLELFHYALSARGLLLLGREEALGHADLFLCENTSLSLFRRRAVPLRQLALPRFAALAVPAERDGASDDSGVIEPTSAMTDAERRKAFLAVLADELRDPIGPIGASTPSRIRPHRRKTGAARTPTPTPFAGYRVLIVDDNADAVESLGMLVGVLGGSDVRMALDGLEALEVATDFKPDVVLLDLSLPQLSGVDVAARIRSEPWGRDVILVAVTGWGQDKDKELTKAAGFDHHITKPADSNALAAVLRGGRKLRGGG